MLLNRSAQVCFHLDHTRIIVAVLFHRYIYLQLFMTLFMALKANENQRYIYRCVRVKFGGYN